VSRADDLSRIEAAFARIGRVANSRRAVELREQRSGVRLQPAMLATLATVYRRGPIRLTDIAEAIELEPSRVSKEVQRLLSAGLVAQQPDPGDRRSSLLSLTERGREAFERYRKVADDILAEALADWSDQDLAGAASLLGRLATAVNRPSHRG
jgi:DNA-binding MarR family transcriptional regulator